MNNDIVIASITAVRAIFDTKMTNSNDLRDFQSGAIVGPVRSVIAFRN